jgi:sRNA-binding carbon storage regulator CsrA
MLSIAVKNGDGFTIGPQIVVKLKREPHGYVRILIKAPKQMLINRIDGALADVLIRKLSSVVRDE